MSIHCKNVSRVITKLRCSPKTSFRNTVFYSTSWDKGGLPGLPGLPGGLSSFWVQLAGGAVGGIVTGVIYRKWGKLPTFLVGTGIIGFAAADNLGKVPGNVKDQINTTTNKGINTGLSLYNQYKAVAIGFAGGFLMGC